MPNILSARLIGVISRKDENGKHQEIYSLLVTYDTGESDIVSGTRSSVRAYLPYLIPEADPRQLLAEHEARIATMLEDMVERKLTQAFRAAHPVPELAGMREDEAARLLIQAGYTVVYRTSVPEGTPLGTVRSWTTLPGAYLTAQLDVIHILPEVTGLAESEALSILSAAGFSASLETVTLDDTPPKVVSHVLRENEDGMHVRLFVTDALSGLAGTDAEEAIRRIEAAGYRAVRIDGPSDTITAGRVVSVQREGNTVRLNVSDGPLHIVSASVHAAAKPLDGSSGDTYTCAQAECIRDAIGATLRIPVTFTLGVRQKRTIDGVSVSAEGAGGIHLDITSTALSVKSIAPGEPTAGILTVGIRQTSPGRATAIHADIVTAYGLIAKRESIRLDIDIAW